MSDVLESPPERVGHSGTDSEQDARQRALDALASAGYAVASVDYRLAPKSRDPVQIEDVKCAIRYLRANAGTYGLNGSQMYAFGTSVGGQLVASPPLPVRTLRSMSGRTGQSQAT
jgi:acetyl esterase/lipase